jgi:hypothetical protein|tara:strand:+ start:671 stop:1309 length:639 start_codon:yes stop_codon:yes gene_type:complete
VDELVLFSGGTDSTILLIDLLKKKVPVRVLYLELGWCRDTWGKQRIQGQVTEKVLDYVCRNYGTFKFSTGSMFLDLEYPPSHEGYFGKDGQWSAFYGSLFCRAHGLDKMWGGWFTYTDHAEGNDYIYEDRMQLNIDSGSAFCHKVKLLTPKSVYNGTDIDRFKNKKEAWDSLPWELKLLVRSCFSDVEFCGECVKCRYAIEHKIKDKYGNPL